MEMIGKKIGESLVERGLISAKELEMALKAQLIFGGQLGTCLIELGMLDEASLGRYLSETFGAPHAPPEALQDIPEATIRVVPGKVAEEYKVIPFRVAPQSLHLAMVDPRNLQARDELSFVTGKKIIAWVTPEIRIYQALERYYGVARRLRYISICRALDRAAADQAEKLVPKPFRHYLDEERGVARATTDGTPEQAGAGPSALGSGGAPGAADIGVDFGYGKSWHEVAAELRLDEKGPSPEATGAKSAAASPGSRASHRVERAPAGGPASLPEVAELLCSADTKDELADAVFAYTGPRMARCMLLGVQGGAAAAWTGRGVAIDAKNPVRMPVTAGIFELLLGNELYRGPMPAEDGYLGFYRAMDMDVPSEILLVPIYVSDRLVAIFLGDGGPRGSVEGDTDAYLRLFRLFSISMSMLILKNRIRDAARPAAEVRKLQQAPPTPAAR